MEVEGAKNILTAEVKLETDMEVDEDVGKLEEPNRIVKPCPKEEAEGEDPVVRELDVFLSTGASTSETQLYVLQYPLRPSWRPYDLQERCEEIRVKLGHKRVEVDLAVDTTSETYDAEAAEHLRITKQTLTSSRVNLSTSYAVGVLKGDELHLRPLDALVQLRPSFAYLDAADKSRKKGQAAMDTTDEAMEEEGGESKAELVALQVQIRRRETEKQEETRLQSHAYLAAQDEAEPWISLDAHGIGSEASQSTLEKMRASERSPLPCGVPPSVYVDALAPGRLLSGGMDPQMLGNGTAGSAGLSRTYLLTLPMDERYHVLMSKGPAQVVRFERLMKLCPPDAAEEDVLDVIQDYAVLVQGCWVAASHVRYTGTEESVRDYVLLLFTKSRVIHRQQLEELAFLPKELLREVLSPIAQPKGGTQAPAGWEFMDGPDRVFAKRHVAIVKQQADMWAKSEPSIRAAIDRLRARVPLNTMTPPTTMTGASTGRPSHADNGSDHHHDDGAGHDGRVPPQPHLRNAASGKGIMAPASAPPPPETMSPETKAALPAAVREILARHGICNLQFLCQCLREGPITLSQAPRPNARAVASAVAAARAAEAPMAELALALSAFTGSIDSCYFQSSLNNSQLDPFRNVVIGLLREKGSNVGLRKNEVLEAAKQVLRVDVPMNVYHKVLKELCLTRGGVWVLKPGDGRPN